MKKMISSMKTLVALLMVGATVTSCSSDDTIADQPVQQPAGPQVYTMTVEATKGGDGTRALTDAGSTLTATWATTENVYVKKVDTWATGSLKPQADGATATLKGTLSDVTIAANDVLTLQFPKSGDITYAGQKGTLADIAANFDWATATIEVASVEGGNITPKAGASFGHRRQIRLCHGYGDGEERKRGRHYPRGCHDHVPEPAGHREVHAAGQGQQQCCHQSLGADHQRRHERHRDADQHSCRDLHHQRRGRAVCRLACRRQQAHHADCYRGLRHLHPHDFLGQELRQRQLLPRDGEDGEGCSG